MKLNYNHLRYFYFVAHEESLTRAARHLNISQSALSVQIKTLESELGQNLFERRGRQLLLTEVGKMVLDYADAMFRTGEELLDQIARTPHLIHRVLRVGAITTLSRNFQIEFYGPLLANPEIELILSSGSMAELLQRLESYQLDVVLTNTAPARDGATSWVSHLISEQPVSLIGSARFDDGGRTLAELLNQEPLLLPSLESNIRIAFDALIERLGVAVSVKAEVNDMTMLRLVARERIGLAVVPPIVVKDELDQGVLKVVREIPDITETFYAVTVKRTFPNPLIRELLGVSSVRR